MRFFLEAPAVVTSTLALERGGGEHIVIAIALEKPTITIRGEAPKREGGEASLEFTCNCPDGEEKARAAARELEPVLRMRLSFRKTAPSNPFSCEVCRPLLVMLALGLSQGEPRPLEEAELLLSFREAAILRTVFLGGLTGYFLPQVDVQPPTGPWMVQYLAPPPRLRLVLAKLPHLDPVVESGARAALLLATLFRMAAENDVVNMPRVLEKLATALGRVGDVPLIPLDLEGGGWFLSPLPSPEECSRDLMEYRERLAQFLEENSVERVVTRASPGGVLEIG